MMDPGSGFFKSVPVLEELLTPDLSCATLENDWKRLSSEEARTDPGAGAPPRRIEAFLSPVIFIFI